MTNETAEVLRELFERLNQKANTLRDLAAGQTGWGAEAERYRLIGKAQGVDLALSFIDELMRAEVSRG